MQGVVLVGYLLVASMWSPCKCCIAGMNTLLCYQHALTVAAAKPRDNNPEHDIIPGRCRPRGGSWIVL